MSNDKNQHRDEAGDGFSASWLALREPADHIARNKALDKQLANWFSQQQSHHVLELGAGTGSNLRYLMPQLGHGQQWVLLDNDARLFEHLPDVLHSWALTRHATFTKDKNTCRIEHESFSAIVEYRVINLATELDQIPVKDNQLITASALLDLTSATWLNRIATMIIERQCACLFTLNYNGKVQWQPELNADNFVSALLNEHQLNDKGFGKAMGPQAGYYMATTLQGLGRHAITGDSDWVIPPHRRELQVAIIDGWSPAAQEQDNSVKDTVLHWHSERKQSIDEGQSTLTVGHVDVLSLPGWKPTLKAAEYY